MKLINDLGGRTFAFALLCLVFGILLALVHKLDPTGAGLIVALAGIVAGRSVGADKYLGTNQAGTAPPATPTP